MKGKMPMSPQMKQKEKEMMAKMPPTKGMGPGLTVMIGLGKKGAKKGK